MHTKRRMTIRNKLFMEHITDQIAMGEASDIINGAIEITHVEITPDFKHVNIFWNHTDIPISEESLKKCAKIIRHELSQLRVIGVVPPIQFVANRQQMIKDEVEKKLAIIESDIENLEILSFSEQMELANSHINQASHKISVVNDNPESDEPHIELPMMRHDVLGLDHHKMMTQIIVSMSKSKKAIERRMLNMNIDTDNSPCNDTSDKVADFLTKNEEKELFKEFLDKRRKEARHKYRMKQLPNQQLLDCSEEEMDHEENYNEKYNFEDEYYDDFEDEK
ncbi:PREDICTED: uncharacterized protein LOC106743024 isoform X2 [Dinoponera quadriceps]|nr:PREDICTED: uncharacterized protein LOC106743024 isoform X2 [Dinoponera quadriceps]